MVQASVFKAKCLSLLDEVSEHHTTIVVTKHGRPVAKLVAVDEASPTMGSVFLVTERDEDYFSTGDRWDAD